MDDVSLDQHIGSSPQQPVQPSATLSTPASLPLHTQHASTSPQRGGGDNLGRPLHRFKSGQTPILLATDVAGRGLDIPTVDLVIYYDIPRYARDYIHRVGRTARAGRGWLAVDFVTQNDVDLIHEIVAVVGKQLDELECKENDVLADITKVYKAKRIATMKMMDDGFEQKAEERKAQKLKTLSEKGLLKEKTNNEKRRRTKTTSAE
ncbi:hypothetical protein MKX03_025810 [Papaver bracteatum]|nr:hypothetical protein MKX03_025810 [Papaver bracteatum]